MPIPKFHGLYTVDTTSNDFGVVVAGGAPVARTIASGDYFIRSYTGEGGGGNLIERFEAQIDAVAGADSTVTVSDTTGRVTIRNNHAVNSLQINWTDTALRDFLGFTGVNTGAIAANGGTSLGASQAQSDWYPDAGPSELDGDPDAEGFVDSDSTVTVAPSGRVVTTKFFEHWERALMFDTLDRSKCLTYPSSPANESYENFWQRITSTGRRFRYYPDREDNDGPAGTGPFTYVAAQRTAERGTHALDPLRRSWSQRYKLTIDVRRYVS